MSNALVIVNNTSYNFSERPQNKRLFITEIQNIHFLVFFSTLLNLNKKLIISYKTSSMDICKPTFLYLSKSKQ